jgi:hypothetical protein
MNNNVLNNFLGTSSAMSLSEVSKELEATACDFCIFRRKIAGEALKTVSFISSFYILAGSYWGGFRIRFCVIPLSSIFPFMNFGTKKGKGGSRYDCVSRQDGGGRANSNKKELSFLLLHGVNHKIVLFY